MNANFKSLKGRSSMTMTNLSGAARFDAQQFPTEQPARVRRFSTFAVCRYFLLITAAPLLLAPSAGAPTNLVLVWSDEFNRPACPFTPPRNNNPFWTFQNRTCAFSNAQISDSS